MGDNINSANNERKSHDLCCPQNGLFFVGEGVLPTLLLFGQIPIFLMSNFAIVQSPFSKFLLLGKARNTGGLPLITYAPSGRGEGSSPLYISIVYYIQKGGGEGPDSR